jgi:AcrR family transcriptional regulator
LGGEKAGRRRAGRPRAGQEPLTRGRILEAALKLVDQEGIAALSMRRLAAELGVDPMSIYHHLPGKQAVLSGLVKSVFAEMRVPSAGDKGWQDRVRDFARAYRDLARAHPNLVLQIVSDTAAAAEAALEASEPLYQALDAAGFPPHMVVRAADLVVDHVHGFALAWVTGFSGRFNDQPGMLETFEALFERHPDDSFPAMRRVFGALTEEEMHPDFEFGLDVLLAGLRDVAGDHGERTSNPR